MCRNMTMEEVNECRPAQNISTGREENGDFGQRTFGQQTGNNDATVV